MYGKLLVGTAVWLASNKTGRKVAVKTYKALSKLGNYAVRAMPNNVSKVFSETENIARNLIVDDGTNKNE